MMEHLRQQWRLAASRTDPHSIAMFNPADYEYLAFYDLNEIVELENARKLIERGNSRIPGWMEYEAAAPNFAALDAFEDMQAKISSQDWHGRWFERWGCDHCGASRLRNVNAYRHKPSGDIIVIGSTCSIKADLPNRNAYELAAAKQREETRKRNAERLAKWEKWRLTQPEDAAIVESHTDWRALVAGAKQAVVADEDDWSLLEGDLPLTEADPDPQDPDVDLRSLSQMGVVEARCVLCGAFCGLHEGDYGDDWMFPVFIGKQGRIYCESCVFGYEHQFGKTVTASVSKDAIRCTNAAFEAITGQCPSFEIIDGAHFLEVLRHMGFRYEELGRVAPTVRALKTASMSLGDVVSAKHFAKESLDEGLLPSNGWMQANGNVWPVFSHTDLQADPDWVRIALNPEGDLNVMSQGGPLTEDQVVGIRTIFATALCTSLAIDVTKGDYKGGWFRDIRARDVDRIIADFNASLTRKTSGRLLTAAWYHEIESAYRHAEGLIGAPAVARSELDALLVSILSHYDVPNAEYAYTWPNPHGDAYTSMIGWDHDGVMVPVVFLGSGMQDQLTVCHEAAHLIDSFRSGWWGRPRTDTETAHGDEWAKTFVEILARFYPKAYGYISSGFRARKGSG